MCGLDIEKGRERFDQPPEGGGPGVPEKVHELSVGALRHTNKLREIDAHHSVLLRLGPSEKIPSTLAPIDARVTRFKGNIPGTQIQYPPIHFLTRHDFVMLHETEGLASVIAEKSDVGFAGVLDMTYQRSDGTWGAIEVPVDLPKGEGVPDVLKLSGWHAKELFTSIVHESSHYAGSSEFNAYYREEQFAYAIGHRDAPPDLVEIIRHVFEKYDLNARIESEGEFLKLTESLGQEGESLRARFLQFADDPKYNDPDDLEEFGDGDLGSYSFHSYRIKRKKPKSEAT